MYPGFPPFDVRDGDEVASRIKHESAPAEAGGIDDTDTWYGPLDLFYRLQAQDGRRKKLAEGLDTVEQAGGLAGLDADGLGADIEPISFFTQGFGKGMFKDQRDDVGIIRSLFQKFQTSTHSRGQGLNQQVRLEPRFPGGGNHGFVSDLKMAILNGYLVRLGNETRNGLCPAERGNADGHIHYQNTKYNMLSRDDR